MSTVQIKIAGVDQTANVLFETAHFESAVNGQAGPANLRVRDLVSTLTVVPGALLELIIDGNPVWTGFIQQVTRVYVFPALNVADFGLARFLDLVATDINVLFSKRIAFNGADPENILSPIYPVNTPDTTAIADLVTDWLDLSGDGIDTSTLVDFVGNINVDQKARPWEGSDTWGQAMGSIALLPAAIYYLDPRRNLVYCDTDTPTAPFGLSDRPNGTTKRGYREMEVLLDGSNLANDVLCWGIGYGSSTPVFKRAEDATSQTNHGLWQLGQVTYGIYKQATIDRVADSILNGSPDHHRGSKDDRPAVTLVTYEPGLLPAQKVSFESQVFGYSDVLPIRKMSITFEAKDNPRYELILSHEIDTPWSFFDPFRFNFHLPRLTLPPFPVLPSPQTPGGCLDCGATDTFGRVIAESTHTGSGQTYVDVGPSDSGILYGHPLDPTLGWSLGGPGSIGLSLDGTSLVARFFGTSMEAQANGFFQTVAIMDHTAVKSMKFKLTALPSSTGAAAVASVGFDFGGPSGTKSPNVWINSGSYGAFNQSHIGFTATLADSTLIPDGYWQAGVEYTVSLVDGGVGIGTTITITDGVTAYSRTSSGYSGEVIDSPQVGVIVTDNGGTATSEMSIIISEIDIPEITRCTENRYELFQRSIVPNGWAGPWTVTTISHAQISVDYGHGNIDLQSSGGSAQGVLEATGTTGANWMNPSFDMVVPFRTSNVANTGLLRFLFFEGTFTTFRGVDLNMAAGTIGLLNAAGSTDTPYTAWADSDIMFVRFQVEAGVEIRARVWRYDEVEPGTWNVVLADTDATVVDMFRVEADDDGGATDSAIRYFWIDFTYDGKPCYENCLAGPELIDDFNRTEIGTWGASTPTGYVWGFGQTGTPSISVNGTRGVAALPSSGIRQFRAANLYIQDPVRWTGTDFEVTAQFEFDRGPTATAGDWNAACLVLTPFATGGYNTGGGFADTYAMILRWARTSADAQIGVQIDASNSLGAGSAWSSPLTFSIGIVYGVRWKRVGNTVMARVWDTSGSEPGTWNVTGTVTVETTARPDSLWVNLQYRGSPAIGPTIYTDQLFSAGCTPVPPAPPTTGMPVFGDGCENAVRTDSTHYQLTRAFVRFSEKVYVDGLLTRPGITFEYTTDPEGGTIIFNDPVSSGAVVRVCYTANGPTVP